MFGELLRYFEAMGAGAVLLTDFAAGNGADDLFEPGRHFVQYNGADDLLTKFKGLLSDDERRGAISQAAQQAVLARHTYDDRAATIIDHVRGIDKSVYPTPACYFAAFSALNMPAAGLRAASVVFAQMGRQSRISLLNRVVAVALHTCFSRHHKGICSCISLWAATTNRVPHPSQPHRDGWDVERLIPASRCLLSCQRTAVHPEA